MKGSELLRLIEYLKSKGWTDSEIVKLIEFVAQ